jgi:hypothetical protein
MRLKAIDDEIATLEQNNGGPLTAQANFRVSPKAIKFLRWMSVGHRGREMSSRASMTALRVQHSE